MSLERVTTPTPAYLATLLEASGPGATMTRRESSLFGVLCRVVDPLTAEAEVSHLELAERLNVSRRTVRRGLCDLVAAGLIRYVQGDRVGRGTDAVRVSWVRVHVEAIEALIEAGRRHLATVIRAARTETKARMRALLDYRARRAARAGAVDNLGAQLDLGAFEVRSRRSTGGGQDDPVHTRGTPPTGGVRTVNGVRAWENLTECPHGGQLGRCPSCRAHSDAASRRGPDDERS